MGMIAFRLFFLLTLLLKEIHWMEKSDIMRQIFFGCEDPLVSLAIAYSYERVKSRLC